jgi:mevalonate kinase
MRSKEYSYGSARAPGKIILTGEHFVVLGAPAVAMAINMYAYATAEGSRNRGLKVEANIPVPLLGREAISRLDTRMLLEPFRLAARDSLDYLGRRREGISVEVDCGIPVGAGLGSSAATSVAIIAATSRAFDGGLDKEKIREIAFGPESYLHGSPSGVDHATSTYGGMIQFSKPGNVKRLRLARIPTLLVCDTNVHRSTKSLVGSVVKRARSENEFFKSHLDEVSQISRSAIKALRKGNDHELGMLMNRNHELLVQIGVSHPLLDKLVVTARKEGAMGAKLTGAGGGGCMIALCEDVAALSRVGRALRRHGGSPYSVSMDASGVVSATNRTPQIG